MIAFPNCKINLGLNITGKRPDGYHNLETVFYPLPINDAIEVVQQENFSFTVTGLRIDGSENENLCVKAYKLLKHKFSDLPAVHMHLHKHIPMGAGVGGGSADGAFMLKLLNKKFKLNLTDTELIELALQLGSDCPFFIINTPAFATGRGEILEPIPLDLSSYGFVLINPQIHISTRTAFLKLIPRQRQVSIKQIIQQQPPTWRNTLFNDFEEPVFAQYPAIAILKEMLYSKGAVYAAMTGTGSTVYGLFPLETKPMLDLPADHSVYFAGFD